MFIKSKINIINKKHPELSYTTYDSTKKRFVSAKEPNYLIKSGDLLKVIQKTPFENKDGYFYVSTPSEGKYKDKEFVMIDDVDCKEIKFNLDIL